MKLRLVIQPARTQTNNQCLRAAFGLIGFSSRQQNDHYHLVLTIRSPKRLIEAADFIRSASRIRRKQAFLDGEEVKWSVLNSLLACYSSKVPDKASINDCHGIYNGANNLWGCEHLAGWEFGRYGRWKQGRWYFNKPEIKRRLEIELGAAALCPKLDLERMFKIVDSLPASVNPGNSSGWCFYYSPSGPGDVVHRATITERNSARTIHFSGVGPSAHSPTPIIDLNKHIRKPIPLEVVDWVVMKGRITDKPIQGN